MSMNKPTINEICEYFISQYKLRRAAKDARQKVMRSQWHKATGGKPVILKQLTNGK